MSQNIHVFCSYAHKDQELLQQLKMYLRPLEREQLITVWNDTDITPGTTWEEEIMTNLNSAHIILLLISAEFINSDYCYSKEMTYALKRHHARQARVVPIILRPCNWQMTPLRELQALPKNAIPVVSSARGNFREEAFVEIAEGIRQLIEELSYGRSDTNAQYSDNQQHLSSQVLVQAAIMSGNAPPIIQRAVRALDHINPDLRLMALETLAQISDPLAQEALAG